jgi:hypothetical protein
MIDVKKSHVVRRMGTPGRIASQWMTSPPMGHEEESARIEARGYRILESAELGA